MAGWANPCSPTRLCVEELARGWMSVSGVLNTHFIVAYMLRPARHRGAEATVSCRGWRPARCAAPSRCPSPSWVPTFAAIRTKAVRSPGGGYAINRAEDVGDQRRQLHAGGRALVRTDEGAEQAAPQPDRVPHRKANGLRRSGARAGHPRQDRQARLQGPSTPPS